MKRSKVRGPASRRTKRIEIAPTAQVDAFAEISDEFMLEICEFEPGDYLITDESELRDFASFGTFDTSAFWRRIKLRYGLSRSDVGSDRLVQIFAAIESARRLQ